MKWIGTAIVFGLSAGACGNDTPRCTQNCGAPLPSDLTPLSTAVDGDIEGVLLTAQPLRVGPNPVFYRFSHVSDGLPITSAVITQTPVMGMSNAAPVHTCPVSNPLRAANADALFAGKIYFTMPAATGGTWLDQVRIVPDGAVAAHNLMFQGFTVTPTDAVTTFTLGSTTYVTTLTFAAGSAKAGDNAFTLAVHASRPDGTYTPVSDASIALTTSMAAMGHGSSGNNDPVFRADGEYDGVFNLSMSGAWDIAFEIRRNGAVQGTVHYFFNL